MRDKQKLMSDFGVVIVFSKTNNGYYIDYDSSIDFDTMKAFLDRIVGIQSLRKKYNIEPNERGYYMMMADDLHNSGCK